MFRFGLTVVTLLVIGQVQAGIDYTRCEDNYGYGLMIECTRTFVPVGICTSDGEGRCSGFLTQLKCCQETPTASIIGDGESESKEERQARACSIQTGTNGDYVACSAGDVTFGLCTSANTANCQGSYTRAQCCDDHEQTILDDCTWYHGSYEVMVECPEGQVLTGVCSSASDPDCAGSGSADYTGIRCCSIA